MFRNLDDDGFESSFYVSTSPKLYNRFPKTYLINSSILIEILKFSKFYRAILLFILLFWQLSSFQPSDSSNTFHFTILHTQHAC